MLDRVLVLVVTIRQGQMKPRAKLLLAIASGLLAGGFLYYRFGQVKNNPQLYGWQWYEAAVLLAAIGFSGISSSASQIAAVAVGLALAPTLVFGYEVVYLHPAESMWPIVLPLVFFFSLPAPIIGSGLSGLLRSTRIPQAAYFIALASALIIGVLLPGLTNPRSQKFETEAVPALLRQIYDAEMSYKTHQPNGTFACDGTLLPAPVGNWAWVASGPTLRKSLIVKYYNVSLDCPNEINPRSFRVNAYSRDGYLLAPHLSIDEAGQLVVEPATKGPSTPRYAR